MTDHKAVLVLTPLGPPPCPSYPAKSCHSPLLFHQNLLFFNLSLPPIWSLKIPVSLSTKEKIPNPHYLNQQLSFASNKPNGPKQEMG